MSRRKLDLVNGSVAVDIILPMVLFNEARWHEGAMVLLSTHCAAAYLPKRQGDVIR